MMSMKVGFFENGKIVGLDAGDFKIPFVSDNYGFFISKDEITKNVELRKDQGGYTGNCNDIRFSLNYALHDDHLELQVRIENNGCDFSGRIGFHVGVDTYMPSYPEWNDKFFPTLLRCEKTHIWGYYMNTAENALAVASSGPVASYDIIYNRENATHCGHLIYGTDILFYQDTVLPERHPDNLKVMKAGDVYTNTVYLIPVKKKTDIKKRISETAAVPVIDAVKYTKESGETLDAEIIYAGAVEQTLILPDGTVCKDMTAPMTQSGLYLLKVEADNGMKCEGSFFVRKAWDYYLKQAAVNALAKPPKATTHMESFYGLFSSFLYYKHSKDTAYGEKAYAAFEESMQYMFDMEKCVPITIPYRIQNTSAFISLLVDIYEADPANNLHYLQKAAKFADFIMAAQDELGVYRSRKTHYTCVLYVAKSMLELAQAERACDADY